MAPHAWLSSTCLAPKQRAQQPASSVHACEAPLLSLLGRLCALPTKYNIREACNTAKAKACTPTRHGATPCHHARSRGGDPEIDLPTLLLCHPPYSCSSAAPRHADTPNIRHADIIQARLPANPVPELILCPLRRSSCQQWWACPTQGTCAWASPRIRARSSASCRAASQACATCTSPACRQVLTTQDLWGPWVPSMRAVAVVVSSLTRA